LIAISIVLVSHRAAAVIVVCELKPLLFVIAEGVDATSQATLIDFVAKAITAAHASRDGWVTLNVSIMDFPVEPLRCALDLHVHRSGTRAVLRKAIAIDVLRKSAFPASCRRIHQGVSEAARPVVGHLGNHTAVRIADELPTT